MLVATDPDREGEPDLTGTRDVDDWVETYDAAGVRLLGDRIRPAEDATTVRRRAGEVLVSDGPFAESRESIVGFDVLECADLDEAVRVAGEHPMAAAGRLELRPFWDE